MLLVNELHCKYMISKRGTTAYLKETHSVAQKDGSPTSKIHVSGHRDVLFLRAAVEEVAACHDSPLVGFQAAPQVIKPLRPIVCEDVEGMNVVLFQIPCIPLSE